MKNFSTISLALATVVLIFGLPTEIEAAASGSGYERISWGDPGNEFEEGVTGPPVIETTTEAQTHRPINPSTQSTQRPINPPTATTTEAPTLPPVGNTDCTQAGFLPDPANPHNYYQCSWNGATGHYTSTLKTCPQNYQFYPNPPACK